MLEDILRKSLPILTASLALILGTCSAERKGPEHGTNFYKERMIVGEEESSEEKTRREVYKYANGIEVDVLYRKAGSKKDLTIKILKDPNNLLIKDTPKNDSAEGTIYFLYFGNTYLRQLKFNFNKKDIEVNFKANSDITYRQAGKKEENVPFGLSKLIYIKLDAIDQDIFLTDHISFLERF